VALVQTEGNLPATPQVGRWDADEPVCTPGSVPARGHPRAGDGHPS